MEAFTEIPLNFYLPKFDHRRGEDKNYLHRHPRGEFNTPQEGWVLFLSVRKECVQRLYEHLIPILNNMSLSDGFRGLDHKIVRRQQALDSIKNNGKIIVIFVTEAHIAAVVEKLDPILIELRKSLIIEPGTIPEQRVSATITRKEEPMGTSGIMFGRPFQL